MACPHCRRDLPKINAAAATLEQHARLVTVAIDAWPSFAANGLSWFGSGGGAATPGAGTAAALGGATGTCAGSGLEASTGASAGGAGGA